MEAHVRSRADGIFAWIVCICAVFSNILVFGCTYSFGLIYPALLDEFHEGKAKTAWVGSLALALTQTLSPLAARLINRFGARPIAITGALFAALGLFLTSFVTSINLMYVTFCLMYGLGVSLMYTACYDIVPRYFQKKLALALGVLMSGVGASMLIMSPINEILVSHVGWRKAFIAFAGFALLAGMCCLSFRPHVEKKVRQREGLGKSVLIERRVKAAAPLYRNGRYWMVCTQTFFFQLGNTIPLVHFGRYALDCGLSPAQTAKLYIGYGVSSMIGRFLTGRICDFKCVSSSYICSLSAFLVGSSTIACPFLDGFLMLMAYFSFNGLCGGVNVTAKNVALVEVCGDQQRTSAFGYLFFFGSLGFCSGPPLGGLIADHLGSYKPVFYTSGSLALISGIVILTIRCFEPKYYEETTRTELLNEEKYVIVEKVTVL